MNNIQKLISAVSLGDEEEMASTFSSIMHDKVRTAIDVKTIEVAENIYNAKESIEEAKSMIINRASNIVNELEVSLQKGSRLNKEINKTLGGNYDRDFKEMQDSMDDIFDAWNDIESEIDMKMTEEASITEAKSAIINRTSRNISDLEVMLKRGSKLNKEINKTLGGNYDRNFKEMQDSMDDIFDAWNDIESEIDMRMSESLTEAIDFSKVPDDQLIAWIGRFRTVLTKAGLPLKVDRYVKGNPWSDFKKDFANAEKEAKKRGLKVEESIQVTEAKIVIPPEASEKGIRWIINKAKQLSATEKDFDQSMKPLNLKQFEIFDKIARNHKDFDKAYDIGYDAGMGYDLPKPGGLEGNNPHKKNTFAYWLWMDIAGQGMNDA